MLEHLGVFSYLAAQIALVIILVGLPLFRLVSDFKLCDGEKSE